MKFERSETKQWINNKFCNFWFIWDSTYTLMDDQLLFCTSSRQTTNENADFQLFCLLFFLSLCLSSSFVFDYLQCWQRDIGSKICRYRQLLSPKIMPNFILPHKIWCDQLCTTYIRYTFCVCVCVCFAKVSFVSKCPIEIVKRILVIMIAFVIFPVYK